MTMSPTSGIKHFTYTDFNNNYLYNINDIVGINNIIGGTGVFSAINSIEIGPRLFHISEDKFGTEFNVSLSFSYN